MTDICPFCAAPVSEGSKLNYEQRLLAVEIDAMRRVNVVRKWLKWCIRHTLYTPDVIDRKAAEILENVDSKITEVFETFGDCALAAGAQLAQSEGRQIDPKGNAQKETPDA